MGRIINGIDTFAAINDVAPAKPGDPVITSQAIYGIGKIATQNKVDTGRAVQQVFHTVLPGDRTIQISNAQGGARKDQVFNARNPIKPDQPGVRPLIQQRKRDIARRILGKKISVIRETARGGIDIFVTVAAVYHVVSGGCDDHVVAPPAGQHIANAAADQNIAHLPGREIRGADLKRASGKTGAADHQIETIRAFGEQWRKKPRLAIKQAVKRILGVQQILNERNVDIDSWC